MITLVIFYAGSFSAYSLAVSSRKRKFLSAIPNLEVSCRYCTRSLLAFLQARSCMLSLPPLFFHLSKKIKSQHQEGSTVIARKPQPRFIRLPLCFPLLPHLRTFVCSLFFRSSKGYDWQRTPRLMVVRELLFFRGGAGESRTIGLEGKRSDKWESWGKGSLRACRGAWVRRGKGRGSGRSSFLAKGAVSSSWKSH